MNVYSFQNIQCLPESGPTKYFCLGGDLGRHMTLGTWFSGTLMNSGIWSLVPLGTHVLGHFPLLTLEDKALRSGPLLF